MQYTIQWTLFMMQCEEWWMIHTSIERNLLKYVKTKQIELILHNVNVQYVGSWLVKHVSQLHERISSPYISLQTYSGIPIMTTYDMRIWGWGMRTGQKYQKCFKKTIWQFFQSVLESSCKIPPIVSCILKSLISPFNS